MANIGAVLQYNTNSAFYLFNFLLEFYFIGLLDTGENSMMLMQSQPLH